MGRLRAATIRFVRAREATSLIEFAVMFPVLLLLLLGGSQIALYIDATRKVQLIATSVSQMVSQTAPSATAVGATTASISAADIGFSYDAAMVIFPYVLADAKRKGIDWRRNVTVNIAGIVFTKTASACQSTTDLSTCYKASVDWTTSGVLPALFRVCGDAQGVADDTAPPSRTSLPRSLFGPGSAIAVDVSFTFEPTFGSGIVPPISITRSAFVQPRYVDRITFDPKNNTGIASQC